MKGNPCLTKVLKGFVILSFLLSTVSCVHNIFSYNGDMVKPENRIPMKEGGPYTSQWKEEDLTVHYDYQKHADTFEISGDVIFANHIVYNYLVFSNFFLTIYFTDATGRIIGDETLTSAGLGQEIGNLAFHKKHTLPSGAKNFVFAYRGRVADHSSGDSFGLTGGIDWQFWKAPTR